MTAFRDMWLRGSIVPPVVLGLYIELRRMVRFIRRPVPHPDPPNDVQSDEW
jgi:hypothetical protein